MSDIAERLRASSGTWGGRGLLIEAADALEALTARLAATEAERDTAEALVAASPAFTELVAEAALASLRDQVEQARASVQAVEGLSHANSVFAGDKMTAIHFYAGKALAALSNTQDPQSLQANQNPNKHNYQEDNIEEGLRNREISADRPHDDSKDRYNYE